MIVVKLRYKTMQYNDLTIFYAKYRKNRSLRLTIDGSGKIKLTCPYYVSDIDISNFIKEKEPWIRKVLSKQEKITNLPSLPQIKTKQKRELIQRIAKYVEKNEILLNTKINRYSLRKMKTLWGSCSYNEKTIRFNSLLYYMSDYFLEYIVLHEMAHLFIPNHSEKFYNLIKKYLPDYKMRWKEHKKVSLS
ncbi:MAG: DUF45 domain-containing protein [Lachnospiraceae bacterium]|nr:DUF45 domain-containing protein [Lachnospiraceae bacterium]